MFRWLRLGDRRGNVAVIAALCAPLMMLMVGAAIDYGYALNINQRLNEAADTAVLSAISPSIAQGAGSYAKAYNGGHGPMYNVAINTFNTNTSSIALNVTKAANITQNINNNASTYTATITYSTSVPTFFAGLVGISSIPISGHAQATTSPLTFIRYYILLDISQSMGIAASQTEMQELYQRIAQYGQGTGGEAGCVFGCHVQGTLANGQPQAYPNEDYAHYLSPYINLRIDSANTAIDDIVNTAISDENATTPNISIGLYTMTGYPSATITPVFPTNQTTPTSTNNVKWQATTNLSPWKSVSVDLGPNDIGGEGDSDLTNELNNFAASLPAQGTGASAASPLNYVFLITDGVVDTSNPSCTYGHCMAALQANACNALKQVATVGVIYTTYLPIYSDPSNPANNPTTGPFENDYYTLVFNTANAANNNISIQNQLLPNLTACATSSNYFFQASYGSDIVAAMQALFATSLQSVRLTQ
jgi:Flp pilus assembly protein TadG